MLQPGELITVAGIVAGLGVVILAFRISRELEMLKSGEITWIPWADRLLMAATLLALLGVVLPLVLAGGQHDVLAAASAACAGTVVIAAGYVPAVLAHYRLIWAGGRTGQYENPEPAERSTVFMAMFLAALAALLAILLIR